MSGSNSKQKNWDRWLKIIAVLMIGLGFLNGTYHGIAQEKEGLSDVYIGETYNKSVDELRAKKGYETLLNIYVTEAFEGPLRVRLDEGLTFEETTSSLLNSGVQFTYDQLTNEVIVDATEMEPNVTSSDDRKVVKLAVSTKASLEADEQLVTIYKQESAEVITTLKLNFAVRGNVKLDFDSTIMDQTSTMGKPKEKPTNIGMKNGGFEIPRVVDNVWFNLNAFRDGPEVGKINVPFVPTVAANNAGVYKMYVNYMGDFWKKPEYLMDWKVQVLDAGSSTEPTRKTSIEFMRNMSIVDTSPEMINRKIPAIQERQFVELNAAYPTKLYQTHVTTPEVITRWSVWHTTQIGGKRPASEGVDTLGVQFGPSVDVSNFDQKYPTEDLKWTTGKLATWDKKIGSYIVPKGQTSTVFGFYAAAAWQNRTLSGNYLDDVTFTNSSFIELVKKVEGKDNVQGEPGKVFTYTIDATNIGEMSASKVVITDELPKFLELDKSSLPTGVTYDETTRIIKKELPKALDMGKKDNITVKVTLTKDLPSYWNSFEASRIDNGARVDWQDTGYTTEDNVPESEKLKFFNYSNIATIYVLEPIITKTVKNVTEEPEAEHGESVSVKAGDLVEFKLELTSKSGKLTDPTVTDAMPKGLTITDWSLNGVDKQLTDVTDNVLSSVYTQAHKELSTYTVRIHAIVGDEYTDEQILTNEGTLEAPNTEIKKATAQIINYVPSHTLKKVATNQAGEVVGTPTSPLEWTTEFYYDITYENTSTKGVINPTIIDELPKGIVARSRNIQFKIDDAASWTTDTNNLISEELTELNTETRFTGFNPGQTLTIRMPVKAMDASVKGKTITNTASAIGKYSLNNITTEKNEVPEVTASVDVSFGLSYLNLRQVVLKPDNNVVQPERGYVSTQVSEGEELDPTEDVSRLTVSSTVKDAEVKQADFTKVELRLTGVEQWLTVQPVIPEYYDYVGHVTSHTPKTLSDDHQSGKRETTRISLDYLTEKEYWVTIYLTPKLGANESDPRPYSWSTMINRFGELTESTEK